MKVKIGNAVTTLPKDVVASHMANLLATQAILSGKENNFKDVFYKKKDLCLKFLKANKRFVFFFGDEKWYDKYDKFEISQYELLMQDLIFTFSDGTVWSISLNDIANLKIISENLKINKEDLLKDPMDLAIWAQNELTWDQIKSFAILKNVVQKDSLYNEEWSSVAKKVLKWNYLAE